MANDDKADEWQFSDSHLRFNYEILITEYKSLREEIISIKSQVERTYAYLFAVIGAIAASQLLSEKTLDHLHIRPWTFMAGSVLALWFPINHLLISADMMLAGTYIRDIITPKLNEIARKAADSGKSLPESDIYGLLGWHDAIQKAVEQFDQHRRRSSRGTITSALRNPMSWEQFMAFMRMDYAPRYWWFVALYIARIILLYVPSILLFGLYIHFLYDSGRNISVWEPLIWVVLLGLVVLSVVAQGRTVALIRDGIRADSEGARTTPDQLPDYYLPWFHPPHQSTIGWLFSHHRPPAEEDT